jgi:ArsR family transcriptional regulator
VTPARLADPHLSENDLEAVKLPEAVVDEAVRLARGFADPTRLRILALLRRGEVCVHQIVTALAMEQSAVSHQLRVLRHARLVSASKRGRHVYYRLADEHVASMLEGVLSHSQEA